MGTQSCCHLGALESVHPHASGPLIYSPASGGSAVAAPDSHFPSTASTLYNLTTSQGPLQCYLPNMISWTLPSPPTPGSTLWNFILLFNILHSLFQLFKYIQKYSTSGWKLLEVEISVDKDPKNSNCGTEGILNWRDLDPQWVLYIQLLLCSLFIGKFPTWIIYTFSIHIASPT